MLQVTTSKKPMLNKLQSTYHITSFSFELGHVETEARRVLSELRVGGIGTLHFICNLSGTTCNDANKSKVFAS